MAEKKETKVVETTAEKKAEVTKMTEKKQNKILKFFSDHKEGIIAGTTMLAIGTAFGYGLCKVTHYESPNTKLDDGLEAVLTTEMSEKASDAVSTPEIDNMQNPEA